LENHNSLFLRPRWQSFGNLRIYSLDRPPFPTELIKMIVNKPSQLFLVILAVSLLGSCGSADPKANAGTPATKVKLATVQTATIDSSSEFVASLESRRSVTLIPQITGRVTKILVKYGESVPAGTELIEVNTAQQQAAVNSNIAAAEAAQANLKNAQATLSQLEAQRLSNVSAVNYNKKQYQRYVFLSNQGAVPVQNRDQYAESIQQAVASLSAIDKQIQAQRATIASSQKAVLGAQANTQQQRVQLGYFKIKAPFAGIVGDIPVKLGDLVDTSTQLTTITQNQPLEVNTSIPIEDGPKLRQGMTVELLNGKDQKIGSSRVFFIAPSTNNNTQSVLVKSLFDNSNNQLRANQYVRAKVIWSQQPGVLIPTTAISRIGGENFVYVAQTKTQQGQDKQGKTQLVALEKPVKLGDIQGNSYQVLSGLQPGEKLIVSGILTLSNGAVVTPES